MGLFKSKEEIPKIPQAPTLPELPGGEVEEVGNSGLPELPTLPSGSNNENINQEMVKSAVSDPPAPVEEEVSEGKQPLTREIEEEPEESKEESSVPEFPISEETEESEVVEDPIDVSEPDKEATMREIEPIFIRIDKFQIAQRNFENIKEKVKDIEATLKKIKDVKHKEDEEILNWSKEVENLKSRLVEIDSEIFSQI